MQYTQGRSKYELRNNPYCHERKRLRACIIPRLLLELTALLDVILVLLEMSLRKYNNRKRRHTQAFPEEQHDVEETNEQQQSPTEAEPIPEDQPDVTMNEEDPGSNVNGEEDEAVVAERAAKELAVWEIFHEEHYEGMSHTLTLSCELDTTRNSIGTVAALTAQSVHTYTRA